MTLKEIYRQAIKKTNDLDARVLICHCLNISTEKFFLIQNDEISKAQIEKIDSIIEKRAKNIPVAYLTGHKEFFGIDFVVDKNVLIPRPETEWLVEKAIQTTNCRQFKLHPISILDMGTGCGNIIISIACHSEPDEESLPAGRQVSTCLSLFASDISATALKVAKKNAAIHHVDNQIDFIQSDLFKNLKNKKFDIIIANLPYVPGCHSERSEESLANARFDSISFEPRSAIFADDNGAEIIKRFLKSAPNYLNNNGAIVLELDPRNAIDIKNSVTQYFPKSKIRLEKDLAGFWRYLILEA